MYSSEELFMRSREGYFGVYFPSCATIREINTKITLEWAHKQFATTVHTSFYFLHDIRIHKWRYKIRFSPIVSRASLGRFMFCPMTSHSIADDLTMTRHCDAITWKLISNSEFGLKQSNRTATVGTLSRSWKCTEFVIICFFSSNISWNSIRYPLTSRQSYER